MSAEKPDHDKDPIRLLEDITNNLLQKHRQAALEDNQQMLADEEARMDEDYSEHLARQQAVEGRKSTLTMAWFAAQLLTKQCVSSEVFTRSVPVYKTKGIFNKRQVEVAQRDEIAADGWPIYDFRHLSLDGTTRRKGWYGIEEQSTILYIDNPSGKLKAITDWQHYNTYALATDTPIGREPKEVSELSSDPREDDVRHLWTKYEDPSEVYQKRMWEPGFEFTTGWVEPLTSIKSYADYNKYHVEDRLQNAIGDLLARSQLKIEQIQQITNK